MQDRFLPFEIASRRPFYMHIRSKLIANILETWEKYLDEGKEIIIVEYENCWDTIKKIRDKFWRFSTILKKHTLDITSSQNIETSQKIHEINLEGKKVELSWVNATVCILKSCAWMNELWIKVAIKLRNILDGHFTELWLKHNNNIDSIISKYKNYYGEETVNFNDLSKCLEIPLYCELNSKQNYICEM